MKAVVMTKTGDFDVLKETILDRPVPKSKQVLVQNFAAAIEPFDCKIRSGVIPLDQPLPLILGSSVAGKIIEVGSEVTEFKVGQRVAASPHFRSYAEYTAIGQAQVALIPANVSYVQAAAAALSGQTAWQLAQEVKKASLPQGALLINGASGNVGQVLTQVLLHDFAEVYVTVGQTAAVKMQQLFPTIKIINLTDFDQSLTAIVDLVGNNELEKQLTKSLLLKGRLWSAVRNFSDSQRRVSLFRMKSRGASLAELLNAIATKKIKLQIAQVQPFSLINVQRLQATRHQFGKSVLQFRTE
jgi:NADPH:quinone reductase-like Zn-dependent oxidoreductase